MAKKSEIEYERVDWKSLRPGPIVGVDEVGRGCLAGPVVAAAACLQSDELCEGLKDSKLMSEKQREELAPLIQIKHLVGIGFASVEEIDELNILQASLLAMKRAVLNLDLKMAKPTGRLLVDGTFQVPGLSMPQATFIKGDLRVAPISAASIVAKVYRDQWMKKIGQDFPYYGFQAHKGYGSKQHKQAIIEHGPCEWHRKTFRGVREFIAPQ